MALIFSAQAWFTKFMIILVKNLVLLPSTKSSLYFLYRRNVLPLVPDVRLMACLTSKNYGKSVVFCQKLYPNFKVLMKKLIKKLTSVIIY